MLATASRNQIGDSGGSLKMRPVTKVQNSLLSLSGRHPAGWLSIVLGLSLATLNPLAVLSKPQDYIAGMAAYNRHDYVTAKRYFARMIQDAPDDSLGHYYMANTLVFMKDVSGATKEYQTAMENADSDDVRGSCEAALKKLQKSGVKGAAGALTGTASVTVPATGVGTSAGAGNAAGAAPPTAAGATTGSAAAGTAAASATTTGASAAATATAVPANQPDTRSILQRQADERRNSVTQQTENQQKAILDSAKYQADRIKADHTIDPNAYGRRGGYYSDLMKKEGAAQASAVMDRATKQAADYKKYVDEKNAALNDVVNNLDDQMNQTVGSSKVHLKREGTNINVRNYEFSH